MGDEGYPKGVEDVSGLTMPVEDVEGVDCHCVLNPRGDVVEEVLLTRNPLTLDLAGPSFLGQLTSTPTA